MTLSGRAAVQVFVRDDVLSDGDSIVWDAASGQWVPGAGGGVDLTDQLGVPVDGTPWSASKPGFKDPTTADIEDGGWHLFSFTAAFGATERILGTKTGNTYVDEFVAEGVGNTESSVQYVAEKPTGAYASLRNKVSHDASTIYGVPTARQAFFEAYTSDVDGNQLPGEVRFVAADTMAMIGATAQTSQTGALLHLRDENGTAIFRVGPTGNFACNGVSPPAQSAHGTTAADAIACLVAHGLMHA